MPVEARPRTVPPGLRGYLRNRAAEIARPETRAVSEPLADWTRRRIRLDGKPFRFEGHEYLRTIYDDTAQHVVLSKAAQIGGTTWAILKAFHACVMGLNVMCGSRSSAMRLIIGSQVGNDAAS